MAVFSVLNYKTVSAPCQEYVHPWTDSCRDGTVGLMIHAFKYCLKTYISLYLLTFIARRKKPSRKAIKDTIIAILQSSVFLTNNSYWFSIALCSIRRLFGSLNVLTCAQVPAFIASLIAIQFERPSRRPTLCLYVTNVASETLFRMAVWRGLIKPIPNGEVIIFTLSSAALMYLFKEKHSSDAAFSLIRFVVGKEEEFHDECEDEFYDESAQEANTKNNKKCERLQNIYSYFGPLLKYYETIRQLPKSNCCRHKESCMSYVSEAAAKMFLLGYGVQTVIGYALSLKKIPQKPSLLVKQLFTRDAIKMGLFLGGYSAIYKSVSCLLRWSRNKDSQSHAIPAGLLAGTSFYFYKNTTAALYVMWKSLQIIYLKLIDLGYLPELPGGMMILYSFSTSILFHAALLEPQNIRPAYMKFLYGLSGGRICAMNRDSLEPFGLNSKENLMNVCNNLKLNPNVKYSFKLFSQS